MWRPGVFFSNSLPYILRQNLSLELNFANSAMQAGQWDPTISPSPFPTLELCACPLIYVHSENSTLLSCLHCQHFIKWAISRSPLVSLFWKARRQPIVMEWSQEGNKGTGIWSPWGKQVLSAKPSRFPAARWSRSESNFNEPTSLIFSVGELQQIIEIQSSHMLHRWIIYAGWKTKGPRNLRHKDIRKYE